MYSFRKNIRIVAISTILFFLIGSYAEAQTENGTLQPGHEFEVQAKVLGGEWNRDAIRGSIALYENAAYEWRKQRNWEGASRCLREIASKELVLGNHRESFSRLHEALRLANSPRLLAERAKTLSLLSLTSLRHNKSAESRRYLEEALKAGSSSGDLSAQAMAFYGAGEFYQAESDFEKALDFFQKSLDLSYESNDISGQASAMIALGHLTMTLGDPLAGLEKAKKAEALFQEIADKRGLALSRIAIGHLYSIVSEKRLALESYLKAKDAFADDLDLLEKARLLNGIGYIYENYGEWSLSLDYRQQALQLFKRENYGYGQLATLPSLIKLSHLAEDREAASKYFLEAQNISERVGDHYWLAIALKQMGDLYFSDGSNVQSLEYYSKSLDILKKHGLKTEIALIENQLGLIYARQKRHAPARKHFNHSLMISREIRQKFSEADTLFNLTNLDISEGRDDDAFNSIKKSVELTESITSNVLNSKLKSSYFSAVYDRYETYIGLLMKMNERSPGQGYAEMALQASEAARARTALETLQSSEADLSKDADQELLSRSKEIRILLNLKSDRLTDLLSNNSTQGEIQKLATEIKELEHKLEEIKIGLKKSSPAYSAIRNPQPFDVAEFQHQILDDETLLLEFSFGKEKSYLWLVGKHEFSSYLLPGREHIESRIQSLRGLLLSRDVRPSETVDQYQARVDAAETAYWQEARLLSSDLFGQVSDKLSGKRLIVVPDGKLHYLPISALPLPKSEKDEPILLTNETIYEPSASTLLLLTRIKNDDRESSDSKELVVFSDPVFSSRDVRRVTPETVGNSDKKADSNIPDSFRFVETLTDLPRLAASKQEGDSIAAIIGTSRSKVFSGFLATREQVLGPEISDYRIIHFATHALLNEDRPELSGIVLSRYDEKGHQLNEVVRLQDIYGLNLSANLVVMSACNTGVGKEVKGEGLISLTNGFMQVGAKTVLSSLWKVEDQATVGLMENFYKALADGDITPAKALRQAQIKMWQGGRYRSPLYWAAFTLHGDFRHPLYKPAGRNYPVYILIALGTILLFAIFRFRRVLTGR